MANPKIKKRLVYFQVCVPVQVEAAMPDDDVADTVAIGVEVGETEVSYNETMAQED
jgi:hypothetical protein